MLNREWENSLTCLFGRYCIRVGRHWCEAVNPANPDDTTFIRSVAWLRLRNIALMARLRELLYVEE